MKKRIFGGEMLALYAIVLVVIASFGAGRNIITDNLKENETGTVSVFKRHYALITGKTDDEFWDQVYETARDIAMEADAYVEWFGKDLSVEYSEMELAKMAMQASVDGIILQAPDEEGVTEMIDEIVASGIPVITALSDSQESTRQCYVGVNNYDIGILYGERLKEIILKSFKKNVRIMVEVSGEKITGEQNLILLGIREVLNRRLPEGYYVNMETQLISPGSAFATEEYFNQLFVEQRNLPDILICLDERGTKCAYRTSVDHNRVGEVQVIGYYNSEDILQAVEKRILDSTLSVDAEEIGRGAIEALLECEAHGFTNSYMSVPVRLIGQKEAELLLYEKERQESEENEE